MALRLNDQLGLQVGSSACGAEIERHGAAESMQRRVRRAQWELKAVFERFTRSACGAKEPHERAANLGVGFGRELMSCQRKGQVPKAMPPGRADLKKDANGAMRGLTFELRRDQRQSARPGGGMINLTWSRAWRFAVGPRLERVVRRHWWRGTGHYFGVQHRVRIVACLMPKVRWWMPGPQIT